MTQRKLSRTYRISATTVERWYQSHINQKYKEIVSRPCPQMLGIDEHFFTRKKCYATTFVDLKNHNVFDVKPGRSELSLRQYLRRLPDKENVTLIAMDLSETYRNIAKRCFPNALIVADRFHVVRLINHHFLKAWQQHHPEGRRYRGLLSLIRRHQWRLSNDNLANLMAYLKDYPVLRALYGIKQELMRYILLKTANEKRMARKLPKFLSLIEKLQHSPLQALAKTLTSWIEPIVAMWRFTRNNGITEGFHNKMEMISKRAYGFRNFENYRIRVMTHCGWDGIINRTR